MTKLNEEETQLLKSVENGEWSTISNLDEEIINSVSYARNTFKKDKRMNIRVSGRDLDAIKIKALEQGIPYQTLVSSILHKYTTGQLIEGN